MTEIIVKRLTDDPRPDLVGDRELWAALLPLAHGYGEEEQQKRETDERARKGMSTELVGILHGFRCSGAHLAHINGRIVLERGEISETEYAAWRERYLVPHAREVTELLQRLGEVMRGKP